MGIDIDGQDGEDRKSYQPRDLLLSSHRNRLSGRETTTKLLQQAFDKAAELPEDRQEAIARILLAELESEQKWDELFSRPESEDFLERMATEALEAHRDDDKRPYCN